MGKTGFKSVDEYIASQPEAVQGTLARVRSAIRKAVPEAEELISYQIPRTNCTIAPCSISLAGSSIFRSIPPLRASSPRSSVSLHRTRSSRAQSDSRSSSPFP